MKNQLQILFWSFMPLLFFCSCSAWRKPLTMTLTEYKGLEVRTDGFYYSKKFWNFFLYRNGVVLGEDAYFDSLNSILFFWGKNGNNRKWLNNSAPGWGVFSVENTHITIEQWVGGDAGQKYPTSIIQGRILNDTTLLLEGEPFGRDTFFFHYTPIKPDSTNRFIK